MTVSKSKKQVPGSIVPYGKNQWFFRCFWRLQVTTLMQAADFVVDDPAEDDAKPEISNDEATWKPEKNHGERKMAWRGRPHPPQKTMMFFVKKGNPSKWHIFEGVRALKTRRAESSQWYRSCCASTAWKADRNRPSRPEFALKTDFLASSNRQCLVYKPAIAGGVSDLR